MSVSKKLKELLDAEGVKYEVLPHSVTYTAQETAASIHTSGREVAKPVIVTDGREYVMAVLEAPHQVDLQKFSRVSGMEKPKLAGEVELKKLFPDCELGAMPPFGNLYGLKTYVNSALEQEEEIAFDAGSHFEVIRMLYADFKRLVAPKAGDFAAG